MDYEKKYKEALERARKLQENSNGMILKKWLWNIFPELKESEDDKIRRELIDFVKSRLAGFPQCENFIAWLEKQGEHKRFRDFIQIGDKVTRNESGELVNISQLERIAKPRRTKPADKVEPKFKVKYANSEYNVLEIKEIAGVTYYGIEDEPNHIDYVLPDNCEIISEQKPADKVEPKFHEGDWTVSNFDGKARQISEVHFDEYNSYYVVNGMPVNLEEFDRRHHLWTIQDAKVGDVLACNEEILLFKSYSVQGRISLYCWYNGQTNNFHSKGEDDLSLTTMNEICPATKEQRDALMKAMADKGYVFDFEKKELKKIIDEEQIKKNLQDNSFRRMFEQKPTWSEENEDYINDLIKYFSQNERLKNTKEDIAVWLKSLKERVQPKQEWSEEDDKKLIERLKSLKDRVQPQKQWKPSEEQMWALSALANNPSQASETCKETCKDLLEQLKNL